MEREGFKSRLGFILVSAGCAIGIGNVWKFPYVAGQNGGGVFVLLYLFFLLIMGIPVLTMEIAIGRAGRKSISQSGPGHRRETGRQVHDAEAPCAEEAADDRQHGFGLRNDPSAPEKSANPEKKRSGSSASLKRRPSNADRAGSSVCFLRLSRSTTRTA